MKLVKIMLLSWMFSWMFNAIAQPDPRIQLDNAGEGNASYIGIRVINDLDGDGWNDIVARFTSDDNQQGLQVISGRGGATIRQYLRDDGLDVGLTYAVIHDVNQDGVRDLLVPISNHIEFFYQVISPVDFTVLNRYESDLEFATNFALNIAQVGDMNGDGVAEIAISNGLGGGQVVVHNGSDFSKLFTLEGPSGSFFGTKVTTIVDVNADGIDEMLITAPVDHVGLLGSSGETDSHAYIYSGNELLYSVSADSVPASAGRRFGFQAAGLGDIDGDEIADFVISEVRAGGPPEPGHIIYIPGRVYAFSGATGELIYRVRGEKGTAIMGYQVKAVNDVNQDNVRDFAVDSSSFCLQEDLICSEDEQISILSGRDGRLLQSYAITDAGRVSELQTNDLNQDGSADFTFIRTDAINNTPIGNGQLNPALVSFSQRQQLSLGSSGLINGGWFSPARNGEGVIIEFADANENFSGPTVTVSWFTFVNGAPFWLISNPTPVTEDMGSIELELFRTQGAFFGEDFVSSDVAISQWGSASLQLNDCGSTALHYRNVDGNLEGTLDLQHLLRTTLDINCETLQPQASTINRSGFWWNINRQGEGQYIDQIETDNGPFMFFSWFTYRQGLPLWIIASGPAQSDGRAATLPALTVSGAQFGASFSSNDVILQDFGTIILDLPSCDAGTLQYRTKASSVVGEQSGLIDITSDLTGPLLGQECLN